MKTIFSLCVFFLSLNIQAEERMITTTDGVQLYVKVKGTGAPLLYLHGGPGSGSYWFEKFFGEFIESKYTVVYLDQRGVGRSTGAYEDDFSMDRMAKDFEEVRKELGYDSWYTLGHSFGGILQMGYYERYPEAIKGMLMVNCTLDLKSSFCESWGPKATEFTGLSSTIPCDTAENIRNLLGFHINNLREKDLFWKMGFSSPENEEILDATYNDIAGWNGNFSNKALNIQDYWKDYRSFSHEVKVPVLFFYGKSDWMVGPNHFQTVHFPNLLLAGTKGGHIPFIENRSELEAAISSYHSQY